MSDSSPSKNLVLGSFSDLPQSVLAFVQFVKISERPQRNALFYQIQLGSTFQRAEINHVRVAITCTTTKDEVRCEESTMSPFFGMRFSRFVMPSLSHSPNPITSLWKFKLHHYHVLWRVDSTS
jgi:hypothetical protein